MEQKNCAHAFQTRAGFYRARFVFVRLLFAVFATAVFVPFAWATPAYVQGSGVKTVTTTTISSTFSSAQTAGNLNVVAVGWADSTSSVTGITDSAGNVYTLAVGPTRRTGSVTSYLYYATNIVSAAAAANTVTVTISAADVTWPEIRIVEYSGLATSSPLDVAVGANGSSATASTGNFTTTNATDLIAAWTYVENNVTGAGSGYTSRLLVNGDLFEDRLTSSAGTYSATAPINASGYWTIQAVAFKAAASGGDVVAPTAPTGLGATPASSSQINLSWTASSDNVGVTGYRVERCQGSGCSTFAQVGTPTGTTFSDTGLTASTTYRYRVRAADAVPNLSGYSSIVSAMSQAPADTAAPTAPTGLTASAASSTQINLSWTASTDNVGVTGYRVERCQGAGCSTFAQIGTPTGTTFSDTGLMASTSYSYRVRAQDAVPNLSSYSAVATGVTSAAAAHTAGAVTYQYDSFGRLKQVTVTPN
ncbi:MAG: fibronectin type III domain-containing protein [Gammaproteobacteria bacterium]